MAAWAPVWSLMKETVALAGAPACGAGRARTVEAKRATVAMVNCMLIFMLIVEELWGRSFSSSD